MCRGAGRRCRICRRGRRRRRGNARWRRRWRRHPRCGRIGVVRRGTGSGLPRLMAYPDQERQNHHQEHRGCDPTPGRIAAAHVGVVHIVTPEGIFRSVIVVVRHDGSPSIVDAGCQRRARGSRSSSVNKYRLRCPIMTAELFAARHDATATLQPANSQRVYRRQVRKFRGIFAAPK